MPLSSLLLKDVESEEPEPESLHCAVLIDEDRWQQHLVDIQDNIEEITRLTLDCLPIPVDHTPIEISFLLTNDPHIQTLNNEYRGQDKPTNVLSFAQYEITPENIASLFDANHPIIMVGDIILSLDTLLEEARQQQKPLIDHYSHLLVHGLLHLFGYDHENEQDAFLMEQLEITILEKMAINNPYL